MKTNTKKLRKPTHKYVDNSRTTKIVVMPKYYTRAHSDRFKYGLPATFDVDYTARYSVYVKSVNNALDKAFMKESEINHAIAQDIGAETVDYTWILKKVKTSSRKVNLV